MITNNRQPSASSESAAYFSEVVDPLFRPLMAKLHSDKPSSDEMAEFVSSFFRSQMPNSENEQPDHHGKTKRKEERAGTENGGGEGGPQQKGSSLSIPSAAATTEGPGLPPAPPGLEMDSALAEDAVDLKDLFLPKGFDPLASLDAQADKFSLCFSKRALEGWVKQPSPCCAAASAAGAWNACVGVGRHDCRAQSHLTLVPIFSAMLEDQVHSLRTKIERMLDSSGNAKAFESAAKAFESSACTDGGGVSGAHLSRCDLAPLLEAVQKCLLEDGGKRLGGKAEQGPGTRKHLLRLVREVTAHARAEAKKRDGEEETKIEAVAAAAASTAVSLTSSSAAAAADSKEGDEFALAKCGARGVGDGGGRGEAKATTEANECGDERPLTGTGNKTKNAGFGSADDSLAVVQSFSQPSSSSSSSSCPAVFLRLGELYDEEEEKAQKRQEAAAAREAGAAGEGSAVGEGGDDDDVDNEENDDDDDDEQEEEAAGGDDDEEEEGEGKEGANENPPQKPKMQKKKKKAVATNKAKKKKTGTGVNRSSSSSSSSSSPGAFGWKKDIGDWLHKVGGVEKITAARPSTAPFGNWGVLGALKRLNHERFDTDVVSSLLMGKKSKAAADSSKAITTAAERNASSLQAWPSYVPLCADDDGGAVSRQWSLLRSAFMRADSCLIFHLKNHYALIYALREWVDHTGDEATDTTAAAAAATTTAAVEAEMKSAASNGDSEDRDCKPPPSLPAPQRGRVVRQLLTSRRGQRPSAWVDFEEARKTMLGWDGYKIMLVERRA